MHCGGGGCNVGDEQQGEQLPGGMPRGGSFGGKVSDFGGAEVLRQLEVVGSVLVRV